MSFKYLLYGKYDKKSYIEIKEVVDENNYARLKMFCIWEFILSFIAYIFSVFSKNELIINGSHLYLISMIISLVYYVLLIYYFKKNKKYLTFFYYIYILLNLFCYETLGINYSLNSTASIICIVYIVSSIMFIDIPYRYTLITMLFTVWLCYDTIVLKNISYALMDCLYCASAFIIGSVLSYYNYNEFIKKTLVLKKTENERDLDYLTGLKNRISTENDITKILKYEDNNSVMLVIDLDDFKKVNDTYGHDEGDKLLINIASILTESFREEDYVSRIGGDEFVVFLRNISNKKFIEDKSKMIIEKVKNVTIDGKHITGCSIGVAFKNNSKDYQSLFKKADAAMYEAKKKGKNLYKLYKE